MRDNTSMIFDKSNMYEGPKKKKKKLPPTPSTKCPKMARILYFNLISKGILILPFMSIFSDPYFSNMSLLDFTGNQDF